jgi:hypothetical protein
MEGGLPEWCKQYTINTGRADTTKHKEAEDKEIEEERNKEKKIIGKNFGEI